MSISLENVNISRTFTTPLVLPIMHPKTLMLDRMEYVWGLNRGQMSSYFNVAGNFLHIQPELKDAILHGKVALVPHTHVVHAMTEFQRQNRKLPFAQRRIFTDVFPFQPTNEYRIVPLKPDVSLYTLNPTTQETTTLEGTSTSFPTISTPIHPLFLMTYACRAILLPSPSIDAKLGLGTAMIECFNPWHTTAPFEFYERAGAYTGQFGRTIPRIHRPLLPTSPPAPESTSSSSEDSENAVKRCRLSTPDVESIAKWVSDCAAEDFDPVVEESEVEVVPCEPLDSEGVESRVPKRKRL